MLHCVSLKNSLLLGNFPYLYPILISFFFLLLFFFPFFPHCFHNEFCSTSYFSKTVNCLAGIFGIIVPTDFRNSQRAIAILIIVYLEVPGLLDRLVIFVPNHLWIRVTCKNSRCNKSSNLKLFLHAYP